MAEFDDHRDPRQIAHEALTQIRTALTRHPAITTVEGLPHDTLYTTLEATVEPSYIGADRPPGTLTVRWFVDTTVEGPRFTFHYTDDSGFDCGWHNHEQDHVEGIGHYQERSHPEDAYTYSPHHFNSREPARLTWSVLSQLESVLQA